MPIREHQCRTEACSRRGVVEEHYYPRWNSPDPECPECGRQMAMLISIVHPVFCKDLIAYSDPKKEGYAKEQALGGHVVGCKRSFGGTEEKPVMRVIRTRAEQKEYCRAEGMSDPMDFNPNAKVTSDGRALKNSMGERGCWV